MISASGLKRSFGDRTLLAGAICLLHPGKRYRLVGADGSGKTALLGIPEGDAEPGEGLVSIPSVLVVAGKPPGRTAVGGDALEFCDSLSREARQRSQSGLEPRLPAWRLFGPQGNHRVEASRFPGRDKTGHDTYGGQEQDGSGQRQWICRSDLH